MKTIWKFNVCPDSGFYLELPNGAVFLDVQTQNGEPCAWFEVDSEAPREKRKFASFGTGHPIPDNVYLKYLGTFQLLEGILIYHMYEVITNN